MSKYEPPDELSAQLDELISSAKTEIDAAMERFRAGISAMSRFANMDEIDATCRLLEERGEPMYLDEIVRELKRGGLWRGPSGSKGGPDADMKRSISRFCSRNEGRGDRIRY